MGFALLFMLLPSINNTGDALGYAGEFINNGQNGSWLFSPHHLLYAPFGQITHSLVGKYCFGFLPWMQLINALAAGFTLLILYKTLLLQFEKQDALNGLVLAGSAFVTMRFATENETYMIPVAIGMWGTYWLIKNQLAPKANLVWGGFILLGTAVLFHQIHCWWWLAAALFYPKSTTKWYAISASLLFMVSAYVLAAGYQGKNWLLYPFTDAMGETISLVPGLDNIKFTLINLVRTWIQVHGNIPYFIEKSPWLLIFIALSVMCVIIGLVKKSNPAKVKMPSTSLIWIRYALFFQLAWAFFSVGNAEFMCMVPCLAILSFSGLLQRLRGRLPYFALALFCWNLGVFLIPNALVKTIDYQAALRTILTIASDEKPTLIFAREKVMLENTLSVMPQDFKDSFAKRRIFLISVEKPSSIPDNALIVTDAINYPMPMSRGSMAQGSPEILKQFTEQKPIAKSPTLFGPITYHTLTKNNTNE